MKKVTVISVTFMNKGTGQFMKQYLDKTHQLVDSPYLAAMFDENSSDFHKATFLTFLATDESGSLREMREMHAHFKYEEMYIKHDGRYWHYTIGPITEERIKKAEIDAASGAPRATTRPGR